MSQYKDSYNKFIEESCLLNITGTIEGSEGSGKICQGVGLQTDNGQIYVKINNQHYAKTLFTGEHESLKCIEQTKTLTVPYSLKVVETNEDTAVLVLKYLDMTPVTTVGMAQLGEQLARLHLSNTQVNKATSLHVKDKGDCVQQFGFHIPTCYGYFTQDNTWNSDWLYGDRELLEMWPLLLRKLPSYFRDLKVYPSLLHGDFHHENVAQTTNGPVTFDPSSFYGHDELELSIAEMFGGFPAEFWTSYHSVIPQKPGFAQRKNLYDLYNLLNHWNHFGPIGHRNWREKSLNLLQHIIHDIDT